MSDLSIQGLLLSDDLMDASKVIATARASGFAVKQIRSFTDLDNQLKLPSISCIIIDLHHPELDLVSLMESIRSRSGTLRVIGYGSHVDAARLKAARQLGLNQVMPRSQFFESLASEINLWLAGDSASANSDLPAHPM